MYRFALDYLINWQSKNGRKPLIIRGARQVGKSYLVSDFAKKNFPHLVEINFEKRSGLQDLFVGKQPEKIRTLLELEFKTKIIPGETLLFLDEIQAAPQVIPILRYFYEEIPELHVIAAGSLLEFTLSDHTFSMPVGRVEYLYLGPMTFEEFLLALNEKELFEFLGNYSLTETIPSSIHNRYLELVKLYCFLGGMPQVLNDYLQNKSLEQCDVIKHSILTSYKDDFGKYKKKINFSRLVTVFQKLPQLVGEKIKYVNIDPHEKAKDLAQTLDLFCLARLCYRVFHSSCSGLPLGAQLNQKIFKLLFLDIGLMNASLGLNLLDYEKVTDVGLIHQGKMSEQFIGGHLLYQKPVYIDPELYYWVREKATSAAEVDYVISMGEKIIPIEVKSGKSGRLKSLHYFLKEKKQSLGVRFNNQVPSLLKTKVLLTDGTPISFTLLSLPFYLIGQLSRLINSRLI